MENEKKKSVFETLNAVNCKEHTEKKKQGSVELTYLSWPWAWAEVKKRYPDASFTVYKDEQNRPYIEDKDFGLMCYTTVTIDGQTHEMWLPVMNGANKAMRRAPYTYRVFNSYTKQYEEKTVEAATMFDINKTIMRCLVKNLAMFGLGLYIYAGEDLPEEPTPTTPKKTASAQPVTQPKLLSVAQKRDIAMRVMESNVELLNQSLKHFNRADWNELTTEEWVKIYDSCVKKGLVS